MLDRIPQHDAGMRDLCPRNASIRARHCTGKPHHPANRLVDQVFRVIDRHFRNGKRPSKSAFLMGSSWHKLPSAVPRYCPSGPARRARRAACRADKARSHRRRQIHKVPIIDPVDPSQIKLIERVASPSAPLARNGPRSSPSALALQSPSVRVFEDEPASALISWPSELWPCQAQLRLFKAAESDGFTAAAGTLRIIGIKAPSAGHKCWRVLALGVPAISPTGWPPAA